MNSRFASFSIFAWLIIILAAPSAQREAAAEAVEGKIVKRLDFEGTIDVPKSNLQALIQTRPGKPFSIVAANEDIKRLNAKGFFCREYNARMIEGGIEVIFSIAQEPIIDSIEFTGKVKKKHIRRFKELIQARKGDLLRRHQIISDKQAMLIELKSNGHHFAEIQHEILPGPAGGATVRFNINAGKRVMVKNIVFRGAKSFNRRKLRKILKTKIDKWYNSGKYIEESFEEDVNRLREFYRLKGWLDAEADIASVKFSKNKKRVLLTVDIQEGKSFQVVDITFAGNQLFTIKQLKTITALRSAGPYSREVLQQDVKAIRDKYGEKGYVRNEIKFDEIVTEQSTVRIAYNIVEGQKSYVETINVTGNTKTKDIVVRREISLIPGEEFNTIKLDDSLRRLRNLGFFEGVEADYVPGSEETLSHVNINVKEGKTGSFRVGAGFSSNNNFVGNISITQRNFDYKDYPKSWHDFLAGNSFVGDGQSLTVQAQPGNTVSRYRLSFREPYLFDRPISLGLAGFLFKRDRGLFDEKRTGGQLSLGKRLMPDLVIESAYRFEVVELSKIEAGSPIAVIDATGKTSISSISLQLTHDKRDDYFMPSKGYRTEASYEIAGTIFGGDLDLHKFILGHSRYFTLFRTREDNPHVFSVQARSGWEDDIGGGRIPIFEKFFLGGANTVRGFEFRTVGPQDRDEPIGGEFFYQLNAEYRFPLFGDVFQGVVFNDIGNVAPFLGSADDFDTWRAAFGFGIRVRVPALGPVPITLDFAFPWREENGDDTELVSFQFGTAF